MRLCFWTLVWQVILVPATAADDSLSAAIALYTSKDYKGASESFFRIAQARPNPTATYYLALCYEQLHYHRQAVELFGRICTQWPGTDEARQSTEYLKKLTDAAPAPKEIAAANLDPNVALAIALNKPISKAEWEALPAKVRFPISREHGHMMVSAKINGKYCKLAFDTGASFCGISLIDYPDVLSPDDLEKARQIPISRPHGMEMAKMCETEISLNDLKRKVRILGINEPQVSIIGQNFFKEYTYQVDDFYVRLTKAPYRDEHMTVATVAILPSTPGVTSGTARATSQAAPPKKKFDRYTIPFEKDHDTMLIDIEINGYKTKATFDTGCAPDGIVCHPSLIALANLRHPNRMGNTADRVVIGSIIKMDVPVYYAAGLRYPLVGPKIFNRPFTVDQAEQCIRFDY
jgi:hypothetical protein